MHCKARLWTKVDLRTGTKNVKNGTAFFARNVGNESSEARYFTKVCCKIQIEGSTYTGLLVCTQVLRSSDNRIAAALYQLFSETDYTYKLILVITSSTPVSGKSHCYH